MFLLWVSSELQSITGINRRYEGWKKEVLLSKSFLPSELKRNTAFRLYIKIQYSHPYFSWFRSWLLAWGNKSVFKNISERYRRFYAPQISERPPSMLAVGEQYWFWGVEVHVVFLPRVPIIGSHREDAAGCSVFSRTQRSPVRRVSPRLLHGFKIINS